MASQVTVYTDPLLQAAEQQAQRLERQRNIRQARDLMARAIARHETALLGLVPVDPADLYDYADGIEVLE